MMEKNEEELPRNISMDTSDLKMIKIFVMKEKEFTADDLLKMSLPFGCVFSVQKIVKKGFTYGLVTYSNADDAATAMMKLSSNTEFSVSPQQPREVIQAPDDGSGSHCDQLPSLLHVGFSDKAPKRITSLMDTLYPPALCQGVYLQINNLPRHVDQRCHVLSLLPSNTTVVKVERKTALVTLPDISSALWLMDFLNELYTGSQSLHVSFANNGGGAWAAMRTASR